MVIMNEYNIRYFTTKEINKEYNRSGKCNGCGECCKFIATGCGSKEHDKYLRNFKFRKVLNYMILDIQCKHLTKDNKCSIFDSRKLPIPCRQFPMSSDMVYKMVRKKCGFKFKPKKREEKMSL